MRTRDKQRIFRRFFRGESVWILSVCYQIMGGEVENIIREGWQNKWTCGRTQ